MSQDDSTNPEVNHPDDELLSRIRRAWQTFDPPPPDLIDQALLAIAAEELQAEQIVGQWVERTAELAGARASSDVRTMEFDHEGVGILLRLSVVSSTSRRIDGWVTTAGYTFAELHSLRTRFAAEVSETGRFEFPDIPSGDFWLAIGTGSHLTATPNTPPGITTPPFEL